MNIEPLEIVLNQFKNGSLDIHDTVILIKGLLDKPVTYIPYQPSIQPYYTDTGISKELQKFEVTCSI